MPVLTLLQIDCHYTNDIDHADELQCRIVADEQQVKHFQQTMLANQQWQVNESVLFQDSVSIQLWEDGKYKPFFIGQTDVVTVNTPFGVFTDEYHNGAARYTVHYQIDTPQQDFADGAENSETPLSFSEKNTTELVDENNRVSNRGLESTKPAPNITPNIVVQTGFLPDKHGFQFANYFAAKLPFVSRSDSTYGLCGGMVKAAADFFENNLPLPDVATIPKSGSSLYRYLLKRQFQSFGTGYYYLGKFFYWWFFHSTPDTQELTATEWTKIKQQLDQKRLVQLGMVYVDRREGKMWENHQVLAYSYEQYSNNLTHIYIYDPNYPKRNDIFISAHLVSVPSGTSAVNRLLCEEHVPGWMVKPIRGFFEIPLNTIRPPVLA